MIRKRYIKEKNPCRNGDLNNDLPTERIPRKSWCLFHPWCFPNHVVFFHVKPSCHTSGSSLSFTSLPMTSWISYLDDSPRNGKCLIIPERNLKKSGGSTNEWRMISITKTRFPDHPSIPKTAHASMVRCWDVVTSTFEHWPNKMIQYHLFHCHFRLQKGT